LLIQTHKISMLIRVKPDRLKEKVIQMLKLLQSLPLLKVMKTRLYFRLERRSYEIQEIFTTKP
ncbi:hypothetical protein, partial [Enterococcus faecium]|uniref:hypothetical protein n=1 Tax=Enterococcus faecium TaxID=1352 RepID=UPI003CC52728